MVGPQRWFQYPVSLSVAVVGALTFTLVVGVIVLLAMNKQTPEGLIAVMGSGVGALATLLASNGEPSKPEKGDE